MKAGNLRQRANGKWQYRKPYGSSPDGRRRERSAVFTAKNQTEAERIARALVAKWDREFDAAATYRGTVAELLDEVARRGRAEQTDYRARSIRARIRERFGTMQANALTARDLDRWYDDLMKHGVVREYTSKGETKRRPVKLTASTVHHHHREMHAILAQGYKWDMVERNVADKATSPKVRKVDQAEYMPTLPALRVMLDTCTNQNVRMGILLAAATGCRAGELSALRWQDIRNGILYVAESGYKLPKQGYQRKETKSGAAKALPLPADLLRALEAHRVWQVESCARAGETAVEGPILANLRDDLTAAKPYPPQWLGLEWRRLCAKSGVAPFKLHGLRHLHGSLLTDAGVSLAAAAKRQGHGVAVMADRYLHAVGDADIQAANVIGAELSPLFALPQGGEHEQAR